MRYRRDDVVARALEVLDATGLDGLTMRKLAADLGLQPAALYHHFANKDALLAAVADELLRRGRRGTEIVTWESELRLVCVELRDAMLAVRDGAALVSRVHALGLGAAEPARRMSDALGRAGAQPHLARIGSRTLLHFVFGHVVEEQVRREVGPVDVPAAADASGDTQGAQPDPDEDFHLGLSMVLAGLAEQLGHAPTYDSADHDG
ncbi:TetR family transcriptional regulator [Nocardioides sp. zg-536]|uniref:TetR family transcriptional regulator n=1 Tax=Nocardioides faecalis TaxID=2803858 RepID=A0A939BUT2_9ACTN|nr:TetR family transcriptional regulator [Nocardioides faecalis]MBM9459206.1 TetR family transcriptional regulator [Nocardioides faecalis]MBS4751454.1 TetR family transcriptional regulator [Nocardioides faecalis]QVI59655.1 TetR family transcriptional regulator [Nocardioides faecalis]